MVYARTYECVCIYVCIDSHVYIHVCGIYVCGNIYTHMYVGVWESKCMYVYMYVCMYVFTYLYFNCPLLKFVERIFSFLRI